MKNQYFGDLRDFIKYDLLLELVDSTPGLCRLTNIPMLTPNDGTGEGNVTAFEQGNRRPDLYHFLRYCLARGDRNIRNLRSLFQGRHYSYCGHRDDLHYQHDRRDEYFTSVVPHALSNALVFIDPDTGIETADRSNMRKYGLDRYLFWDNIVQTFSGMNDCSVLIIYQHLQRNAYRVVQDMQDKSLTLCDRLGVPSVASVDDGDVAFLVTSRSPDSMAHVAQFLPQYAHLHNLRYQLFDNQLDDQE